MLSAAINRVDIVGVVLVVVRLASHLIAVGPIIRGGRMGVGLRLGWIRMVVVDVLDLLAELVSEPWVPPKRHMRTLVKGLPRALSCQRNDRSGEGSKGRSDQRFVHFSILFISLPPFSF